MTTFELILVILYICNGLALYIAELPSMTKSVFNIKDNIILKVTAIIIISLLGLILIVPAWPTILIFKFVKEEF